MMMMSNNNMVITHIVLILLCLPSMVELHFSWTTPPPLPSCPADLTLNLCADGADGSPCSTGKRFLDRILTKLFPVGICKEGFHCCRTDQGLGLCNNIEDCTADSCINGDCIDEINAFSCECQPGFTGATCDTDIDDCTADSCINGDCIDGINDFSCECHPGFTGATCDTATRPCPSEEWILSADDQRCYFEFFFPAGMTLLEAEAMCLNIEGSIIVSPTTLEEREELETLFPSDFFYVGVRRPDDGGRDDYKYTDGTPLPANSVLWSSQANLEASPRDCVFLSTDSSFMLGFNDIICSQLFDSAVCQLDVSIV